MINAKEACWVAFLNVKENLETRSFIQYLEQMVLATINTSYGNVQGVGFSFDKETTSRFKLADLKMDVVKSYFSDFGYTLNFQSYDKNKELISGVEIRWVK